MIPKIPADSIRRFRYKHSGLDRKCTDIIKLTDLCGGLHATSVITPYLSLLTRGITTPFQSLNQAHFKNRQIVRIRAMRNTLFMVSENHLPMLLGAYRAKAREINKYYEYWGVQPDQIIHETQQVKDVLSHEPITQKELRHSMEAIAERQLTGKRNERISLINFILNVLQMEREVISEKLVVGDSIRNFNRFCLVKALHPNHANLMEYDQALRAVIQWYFEMQGPASLEDLAWWSGINKLPLKKALSEIELSEIEVMGSGKKLLVSPDQVESLADIPDKPLEELRLLPYEDPYLKVRKDRAILLSGVPEAAAYENGEARPTIIVDGRVVGLWRIVEHADMLRISVELFDQSAVDSGLLENEKELVISFCQKFFSGKLENTAKGILSGREPYT